jgi:hypothetical protein
MDNIYKNINELYTKGGFLERYGPDLLITILIILIFFIIFSYFLVMNKLEPIKANWTNERCSPSVMPFAGIINAPPGTNKFTYTAENFNGCINRILETIISHALAPIYYVVNVFTKVFGQLVKSLQTMRDLLNKIRSNVNDVSVDLYGRSLNITVPIMQIFITLKDTLAKTDGIMSTGIFTLFGGYLTMKALIGSIIQILLNIVIMLVVFIAILWIVPFTWGTAALLTSITLPIAVLLGTISIQSAKIFNLTPKKVPKPRCFDEDTRIKMSDNTIKLIKDLEIGDVLEDGSKITGFMKSSTIDHTFYNLNGVIVTGTHRVHYLPKGWILAQDHPASIIIENYKKEYMYCLGTDKKVILINDIIFGDWDELDNIDLIEIYANARHILPFYFMRKHVHEYLDGGFVPGTKIKLKNGYFIDIENIKVNDILEYGEKVMTIVKLDGKSLSGVYEYHFENKIITGGPNLEITDINLGRIDTTKINGIKIKSPDYIYNLVTDIGTFYVNDICFYDYNSTTDKYVKKRNIENFE